MVRWNAGTEHVKTQRKKLSPAGQKIEIQKKNRGQTGLSPFSARRIGGTSRLSPVSSQFLPSPVSSVCPQLLPLSFFPSNMGVAAPPDGGSNCIRLKVTKA
jgi:hypothetical protein